MKVHSKTEYVASQKLLHKSLDEYLYLSLFFPPILLGSESSRDHSFSKSAGFDLSGLAEDLAIQPTVPMGINTEKMVPTWYFPNDFLSLTTTNISTAPCFVCQCSLSDDESVLTDWHVALLSTGFANWRFDFYLILFSPFASAKCIIAREVWLGMGLCRIDPPNVADLTLCLL